MKRFSLVASIAVLLIAGAKGHAQGLRITAYGSGSFLQADRSFVVDGDNFTTEFENGGKFGVRGTLDLTNSWAIEIGYGRGRNTFRLTDLDEAPVEMRTYPTDLHEIIGNVKYYFTSTESTVRPFLASGFGMTVLSPTDEARASASSSDFINDPVSLESSQQPTVSFGGGIEGRLTRWFGVRFDVRDQIMPVPRFGLSETSSGPGGIFFPVNGVMNNLETSAGVVIHVF